MKAFAEAALPIVIVCGGVDVENVHRTRHVSEQHFGPQMGVTGLGLPVKFLLGHLAPERLLDPLHRQIERHFLEKGSPSIPALALFQLPQGRFQRLQQGAEKAVIILVGEKPGTAFQLPVRAFEIPAKQIEQGFILKESIGHFSAGVQVHRRASGFGEPPAGHFQLWGGKPHLHQVREDSGGTSQPFKAA